MTTTLQPSALEPSLLTPTTLATMGGLATAVLVIVDSVHSATGWTSAWFALVLAIALTLVAEFTIGQPGSNRPRVARVVLAFINGCLVFTMALGGNQIGKRDVGAVPAQPRMSINPSADRPFFHDWLK